MIQHIDFLPESYHRQRQRRYKRAWRRGLSAVFLSIMAVGAVGQQQQLSRLERDRDEMTRQADEMTAQLDSAEALRQKIRQLDAEAGLAACLQLRVPSTQVLTAVVGTLPRFVSLTEFRTAVDTAVAPLRAKPHDRRRKPKPDAEVALLPEEEDLNALQQQRTARRLFVIVGGVAPDDLALSRYLTALEASGVFDDIQLVYTGQHEHREFPMRRFELRLRVRVPGLEDDDAAPTDAAIAAGRRGVNS